MAAGGLVLSETYKDLVECANDTAVNLADTCCNVPPHACNQAALNQTLSILHSSVSKEPLSRADAINWACDAYNRTTTVANPGNRRPHETLYGEPLQSSSIPFLKPGFFNFKYTNKMDPKKRESFFLRPTRNHTRKRKGVLARIGKVIVTRKVT